MPEEILISVDGRWFRLNKAMEIALAEIHEHAGGGSAAYSFTAAIFRRLLVELQKGRAK